MVRQALPVSSTLSLPQAAAGEDITEHEAAMGGLAAAAEKAASIRQQAGPVRVEESEIMEAQGSKKLAHHSPQAAAAVQAPWGETPPQQFQAAAEVVPPILFLVPP